MRATQLFGGKTWSISFIKLAPKPVVDEHELQYGYTTKWGTVERASQVTAMKHAAELRAAIEAGRESGDLEYHGLLRKRNAAIPAGPWEPA